MDWAKVRALRWRIAGTLVAVAVGAYLLSDLVLGPKVPVEKVVRRDLVQTVVASGRVATPFRVEIGTQITGTVAAVPVEEGQSVKAGQTLIALEDHEAKAGVRQAEVSVAQAQARLRQLRELQLPVADQALRQAEANLLNAQAQFDRNRRLYESGYVGKAVLDDAQRALDVAQTQVESARKQVETARPAGSDYAVAVTALEQAKASLQAARARLDYTVIDAPSEGTLIARNVERGDVVQPGKALMVLSPAGKTQLVLQIDEKNLGLMKLGQKALASADAFPKQVFAAELVYINPGVDAQRGTVEVKLGVPNPPDSLRQDMTVSVDIEIARRASALALPAVALHAATGGSPWVLKVVRGIARRQPVKLGLRGTDAAEILEGLEAGDLVVPAGNLAVKEGTRLRAMARE
jgi:HlyD family secretion protein